MDVFLLPKKKLTSFQIIILGFLGVILLGTILLMLPLSSKDGWVNAVFGCTVHIHFRSVCNRACSS